MRGHLARGRPGPGPGEHRGPVELLEHGGEGGETAPSQEGEAEILRGVDLEREVQQGDEGERGKETDSRGSYLIGR